MLRGVAGVVSRQQIEPFVTNRRDHALASSAVGGVGEKADLLQVRQGLIEPLQRDGYPHAHLLRPIDDEHKRLASLELGGQRRIQQELGLAADGEAAVEGNMALVLGIDLDAERLAEEDAEGG